MFGYSFFHHETHEKSGWRLGKHPRNGISFVIVQKILAREDNQEVRREKTAVTGDAPQTNNHFRKQVIIDWGFSVAHFMGSGLLGGSLPRVPLALRLASRRGYTPSPSFEGWVTSEIILGLGLR